MDEDAVPVLRHPPALMFWCPDEACGWVWSATSGVDYERHLERAWLAHRSSAHDHVQGGLFD